MFLSCAVPGGGGAETGRVKRTGTGRRQAKRAHAGALDDLCPCAGGVMGLVIMRGEGLGFFFAPDIDEAGGEAGGKARHTCTRVPPGPGHARIQA